MYIGLGSGITLAIAAPLGAVLAAAKGPVLPFIISPFISVVCIIFLVTIPVEDTLGIQKDDGDINRKWGKRGFPYDWREYITSHFPVAPGSWRLINAAAHPLDWLTYFLMVAITTMLGMIMIQFALGVFEWSVIGATGAVLSVGTKL